MNSEQAIKNITQSILPASRLLSSPQSLHFERGKFTGKDGIC